MVAGLEAVREGSATGESPEHQAVHNRINDSLTTMTQPLVVPKLILLLWESQSRWIFCYPALSVSGPRKHFGSGGSLTHSNQTVGRLSRSPRGFHSPRGLGGCLTTSLRSIRDVLRSTPCAGARVSLISTHRLLQARKPFGRPLQYQWHRRTVLQSSRSSPSAL
jgi:hypothetical protein